MVNMENRRIGAADAALLWYLLDKVLKSLCEAERLCRGEEYAAWQERITAGLVKTSAGPTCREVRWSELCFFDAETPGTGYATGNRWYQGEDSEGRKVYFRSFGGAVEFYAPRETADHWILADHYESEKKYGQAQAAQQLLHHYELWINGVFGGDARMRLVEMFGVEHFVALAASEPWYIRLGTDFPEDEAEVAMQHGIEPIMLEEVANARVDYDPKQTPIDHPSPTALDGFSGPSASTIWRDQRGRLIGEAKCSEFFELSADQREALERALSGSRAR